MSGDINTKIEKLKEMAIARCRDRIDLAACKAKELMTKSNPENQNGRRYNSGQSVGMTSFLKKRHGL